MTDDRRDGADDTAPGVGTVEGNAGSIHQIVTLKQPSRRRLPNRRANESFTVESFGLKFTITVGRFADGRLAEIFAVNHRASSAAGIMASDGAIAASLALQFDYPVEVLRKAMSRDGQGRATSPIGVALDLISEMGGGR